MFLAAKNLQRAVPAKPGPCGEKDGPRVGSAEWQARQLSSRWQETQVRRLRRAASEWLVDRGVEITPPLASRAQPGGWKLLRPVPVPNGLLGRRPGTPLRRKCANFMEFCPGRAGHDKKMDD